MNALKMKKGDTVQVIAGKDRGKKGKVLSTIPSKGKIMIEGINIATKHKKPRSAQDQGGIVKQEMPLDACKAMVICPKCHKPTRVGIEISQSGEKKRKCKQCGAEI